MHHQFCPIYERIPYCSEGVCTYDLTTAYRDANSSQAVSVVSCFLHYQ